MWQDTDSTMQDLASDSRISSEENMQIYPIIIKSNINLQSAI